MNKPHSVLSNLIVTTEITIAEHIEENSEVADALRAVLKLIDDGDLVRNTGNDDYPSLYLKQALKITSVLLKAQTALSGAAKR